MVTLEASDIEFKEVPIAAFEDLEESALQLHLTSGECRHAKDVPLSFLGQPVKCPKCDTGFVAEWGDLTPATGE